MKKTAIYTRVSTGYQVDKDSLPYQRQECLNYCRLILHADDSEIEFFEDAGKSGKNTDRPGFQRMLAGVKAGRIGRVVVLKIDRISRNLVDFSQMYDTFKKQDVSFISLNEQFDTGSAMGEAMLKIILVFAELERKMTSERVTGVMIGRAKAGSWNGARVPFGWAWDSEKARPVHDPVEGPVVVMMYDMYLRDHSSCRIRDYLNTHDIPTKRGGEWTSKTVSDIIRNPLNRGDYRYNYKESARGKKKNPEDVVYISGLYEPLVDPDVWTKCNSIMDSNQKKKNRPGQQHNMKYPHVFQQLVYCGECGSNFTVNRLDKMRKNGFTPSTYICSRRYRKKACDARTISDTVLGPFVLNYVARITKAAALRGSFRTADELERFLLNDPEFAGIAGIEQAGLDDMFSLLCAGATGAWRAELPRKTGSSPSKESELRTRIDRAERALERLNKAYLYGDDSMSEKDYLKLRSEIEAERVEATNELNTVRSSPEISEADASFWRSASGFLLAHHLNNDAHIDYCSLAVVVQPEVLQGFFRTVISKIYVRDHKVTGIEFKNGIEHRFIYR